MNKAPIITLTVERMQYEVSTLLTKHALQIDSNIQEAVKDYLTEENIRRIIRESVALQTENALRSAVDDFFRFGDGRKGIDAAVKQALGTLKHDAS